MEQTRATVDRYQNGKVYKIINDVDDQVYVGSTCKQYLSQRLAKHKKAFTEFCNKGKFQGMKLYQHMKDIGFIHFQIILVEAVEAHNIDELRAREAYWIQTLRSELNIKGVWSGRRQEYMKQYREQNSEYLRNQKRETYESNKAVILERGKQYRIDNPEKLREIDRTKYEKKRDIILEKGKIKLECECGAFTCRSNISAHRKSQKHQLYVMFGGLNNINV